MSKIRALVILAVVLVPFAAFGDDAWDLATYPDDDSATPNALIHGTSQTHDLQMGGGADQDWLGISVRARQSYEIVVRGSTVIFSSIGGPPCAAGFCASLDRVDSAAVVLQGSAAVDGNTSVAALRWTAAADDVEFARVTGPSMPAPNTNDQYTIEMRNSTLFAPRFNNSATQTSILVLQNATSQSVAGSMDFWSPAGALLHGEPFTIAPRGGLVLNSATLPGVAGQSGSISISHDAGYGDLVGKVVSLEPGTGFTFDTAIAPVPR